MKVGLFAKEDWANLGFTLSECLNQCGVYSKMHVIHPHKFGYSKQGQITSLANMLKEMRKFNIIHFMHSGQGILFESKQINIITTVRDFIKKYPNKKYVIFHGGSVYRENHEKINSKKIINNIDNVIIQTADLLGYSNKNEAWILAPVNTESISPRYNCGDKIIVGHFPRAARKKNTDFIIDTMNDFKRNEKYKDKFEFIYSKNMVKYQENMDRIKKCDVYIDHQCFTLNGRKYGEFGIASLEAAALGKIVVTCSLSKNRYLKEYGKTELVISNSESEFHEAMKNIFNMDRNEIVIKKKRTRQWVEDKHSYKKIGNRLVRFYNDAK